MHTVKNGPALRGRIFEGSDLLRNHLSRTGEASDISWDIFRIPHVTRRKEDKYHHFKDKVIRVILINFLLRW
jgi:hypothetical protein